MASMMAFCSLLLRRECCSFSNGEYLKAGLAELEQWCYSATEEVSTNNGFFFNSLLHYFPTLPKCPLCTVCRLCLGWVEAYQAGCWIPSESYSARCLFEHIFNRCKISSLMFSFLGFVTQVIHQKPKKTLHEITKELCPVSTSSII